MSWYLAFALITAAGLLGIDWWQLHTGRTVRYRHVPHRKLRAVGHPYQGDIPATVRRGSADAPTSVEPHQPAPDRRESAGAGPELQARLGGLDQRRRRDSSSEPPQPAPGTQPPGAGAGPLTVVAHPPSADALPDGGQGHEQPVDASAPDLAPAGSRPPGNPAGGGQQGRESGASIPEVGAPVLQDLVQVGGAWR